MKSPPARIAEPARPPHVVVGVELAGLEDDLEARVAAVRPAAGLLDGHDLLEDLAVLPGQEGAAVDHHVDLVRAGGHGVRGVRELDPQRGASAGERGGDRRDRDEPVIRIAVGGAERVDRRRHHVAVDAHRGDARRGRVAGIGRHRLGDERADLAGGVGALERREVDELDDAVEGPGLRAGLDRSGGETGGALLEPDGVDAREPLEVKPQALLGEVAADHAQGPFGRREGDRLFDGHLSSKKWPPAVPVPCARRSR